MTMKNFAMGLLMGIVLTVGVSIGAQETATGGFITISKIHMTETDADKDFSDAFTLGYASGSYDMLDWLQHAPDKTRNSVSDSSRITRCMSLRGKTARLLQSWARVVWKEAYETKPEMLPNGVKPDNFSGAAALWYFACD